VAKTRKKREENERRNGAPPTPMKAEGPDEATPKGPHIVGIGASAGGLEAFEQFFSHLPSNTGLSFVLVQHLEPTHKGMMPELLARHTKMHVVEAHDGMEVQPNRVYVIPPNADLGILHGKLQVLQPSAPRGVRAPIDFFLRHLAADQKEKAIGIILSGMGSDGSLGVRAIKEQFGIVLVQEPTDAKFDGMPTSAIGTGLADFVAQADQLPEKLLQFIHHRPAAPLRPASAEDENYSALSRIFLLLRAHCGNDFSCYKRSTVDRRIERRMSVHQFSSLSRYARYLKENPQEVETVCKELLIGVTNFFRDPGMFDYLKDNALVELLRSRSPGAPLRIWNPGCSTGEESYSLAIALKEGIEKLDLAEQPAIQIFATDIDQEAIDKARRGTFPPGIATDVSAERLRRFFAQDEAGYRIKKEIRELVVFAPQNVLVDPPFTKIDILCCRNLLIYLNVDTQKKLLTLMHYALNPGGLLILGTAESAGGSSPLFAPLDHKWKVFKNLETESRAAVEMPSGGRLHLDATPKAIADQPRDAQMDVFYQAQRALLDIYGPPSVVINPEGDIVYVNGRTGKYLEPASGKVNNNVFAMAREGLREELGIAIHNASTRKTPVSRTGIRVKTNGGFTAVDLTVKPLSEPYDLRGLLLLIFEDASEKQPADPVETAAAPSEPPVPPNELEDELLRTRERLQTTIEEMQATQEELRSANEELQSNNEELQSTNEELNSSKEELQSLNEEMQTVNAELQSKMEELSRSNNDMMNLLNGIDIATVFLDNDLCIKRFTPQATRVVNLVAGDIGRPLRHFTTKIKYDRLVDDARNVLATLIPKEAQVEADEQRWYSMRILPYRTAENVIDGVVMTFAEVTETKQLEESLRQQQSESQTARNYAENIIATLRESLLVLDDELRIMWANRSYYEIFRATPEETEHRFLYEIGQHQWDVPELRGRLQEAATRDTQFQAFRVEQQFSKVGRKVLLLNGRRLVGLDGTPHHILLAIEDITQSAAKP
jgi:two-component system, chemotaxis family, CheB/CheR fusion protein